MTGFGIPNNTYGQLFAMRIDMVGSEAAFKNTAPLLNQASLEKYHLIIQEEVTRRDGLVGSWQGDGGVAFLGTVGNADGLMVKGEELARAILDRLFLELPDKRFRIGIASEAGKYTSKDELGALSNRAINFAARLESEEAGELAEGSVLACPAYIFSVLDSGIKRIYIDSGREREGVKLYAYVPPGAGRFIPKTEGNVFNIDPFSLEGRLDIACPFLKKTELYFSYIIHPLPFPDQNISPRAQKGWIIQNSLLLPIGEPIFEDDNIRADKYSIYVAEDKKASLIKKCTFYPNRAVIFNDASYNRFPSWDGVFYPQALRKPLMQTSEFAAKYYNECLKYSGDAMITIKFKNISGRERKLSTNRLVNPQNTTEFVYDMDLYAQTRVSVESISAVGTLKSLYNEIIRQSNLDSNLWGWDSNKE